MDFWVLVFSGLCLNLLVFVRFCFGFEFWVCFELVCCFDSGVLVAGGCLCFYVYC